ncbi:MAG: DUF748 domain-containing protein [Candidatus Omnitrophota bacterium]
MKKKFKILILVGIILLAIFITANILLGVFAPRIIENQIQQNLKLKSSLGKISLSLPFTVTLEKLEVGNFASIKKISFSPNLIALIFGKIVIHGLDVVEPVISLELSADGMLSLPVLPQSGKPPAVYLTSLKVENGKIIFIDRKITVDGFKLVLDKLNVRVAKVSLPITSLATNFSLSAELVNSHSFPFGNILFSGWLDYLARDLDAKLEVNDLDIANFALYYGNFISNKKLSSGLLNLSSAFKASNNNLQITTEFNLSKLVYIKTDEEQLDLNLAKDALDLFTDSEGNLRLEFKIDTLLDNPALSPDKIKKIVLKAAMKNLASQSPEQLVDKVANVLDKYKQMGKQLKSIFGQ